MYIGLRFEVITKRDREETVLLGTPASTLSDTDTVDPELGQGHTAVNTISDIPTRAG